MPFPHYCTTCRSLVKNPWVRDVTYYLNERHPEAEQDCMFHGKLEEEPEHVPDLIRKITESGRSGEWREIFSMPQSAKGSAQKTPGKTTSAREPFASETKSGKTARPEFFRVLAILVVIAFGFELLSGILDHVGDGLGNLFENHVEFDIDLGDFRGGTDEDPVMLTDEEVIAQGVPCSQMGHFDILADDVTDEIFYVLTEQGYQIIGIETESYNQVYGNGETWYETVTTYHLEIPGEDEDYQSLGVNYDTATGELHEFDIYLSDPLRAVSLTGALLELLDQYTDIYDDVNLQAILEDLRTSMNNQSSFYGDYGSVAVTQYSYPDGFSIYIGRG